MLQIGKSYELESSMSTIESGPQIKEAFLRKEHDDI